MERLREAALLSIGRASGFAAFGIFCVMIGLSFDPLLMVQTGGLLSLGSHRRVAAQGGSGGEGGLSAERGLAASAERGATTGWRRRAPLRQRRARSLHAVCAPRGDCLYRPLDGCHLLMVVGFLTAAGLWLECGRVKWISSVVLRLAYDEITPAGRHPSNRSIGPRVAVPSLTVTETRQARSRAPPGRPFRCRAGLWSLPCPSGHHLPSKVVTKIAQ